MATIRKRGDKWQARVQLKGFDSSARSFNARADAESWAKIVESEMIRGQFIKRSDAERTTLGEALTRYETEVTAGKRGKEIEALRIKAWKSNKLAQKSLASLRSVDFTQWRDARLKLVKPSTVRREIALIQNLFNVARREWSFEGLLNPVEGLRLPSEKNARNRIFFEGEEAGVIAALDLSKRADNGCWQVGCCNSWLQPIVRLALETAMRRSELLALTWKYINLSNRVAHLPITKNGRSRDVPLSSAAVDILRSLPRNLHGSVFPITANALKLGFVRALARARRIYEEAGGHDPRMFADLHFHDLRHIAVTRLAEKLPNIIELASVSGHQDVRMLKRYCHPRAEDLAKKLG